MTAPATIHVRFTAPGWHCWPDAPQRRAYLTLEHRHLFHVEVATEVTHDDREIEFHDLRDEAEALFKALGTNGRMGAMSCEAMARAIGGQLAQAHARSFVVSVWEDGEFGARVESRPLERPRDRAAGPSIVEPLVGYLASSL